MKAKAGVAAVALWLLTSSAALSAEGPLGSPDGSLRVVSLIDCGSWLSSRQRGGATAYEWYVAGYLNGLAAGMYADFWRWNGQNLSQEQVHFWLDKYCRENPLGYVPQGATELFQQRTGLRPGERGR